MVTTGGLEPPLDRLSTCCLCRIGLHGHGPSGWTRTTTTRVKSPACCVDTTEGSGANGGIRTRTSRLGRPAGNRYPTFALVRPEVTPRPNTDRCRSPVHRHPSVVKDPALASWWAARDSNPNAPLGENEVTARQRTIRSYRPYWRQRQDLNLDPRVLEARMLPLHHAAGVNPRPLRRRNLLTTWPALSRGLEAKTKKALQGIALEGLVLDECRAFRALCPPWGYQASRRYGG